VTTAAWGSTRYVEHLIRPGDSLWKIAVDYDSTVDEIRAANGVKDKDGVIYEGKTLKVPVNTDIQVQVAPGRGPGQDPGAAEEAP
jgi:LysM repeat protein